MKAYKVSLVDAVFRIKNILFRRNAILQYRLALRNGELTDRQLQELNWAKRKYMVDYAYHHIPFYKEYYDKQGFNPSSLHTRDDWANVPILEKEFVRLNKEAMKNPTVRRAFFGVTKTGGSTGHPLETFIDKRVKWEIFGWRMLRQWSVSPAAHVGIVHRRVPRSFIGKLKNRLLWWPTKRVYLNAASITDADLRKFVDGITKKRIVWLQGYVGGLERIADYVIAHGIKIDSLKVVWSTSAPLLLNVRKKMEHAFHCKIMDQYGCCEVPNIAMECPQGDVLHVNYDAVHVDILDSNGELVLDKEGDVLVTDLGNQVFPLIKYRLGDRGTLLSRKCPCGSVLPVLKHIRGRISDAIYTPSGAYVDGNYLTTLFDDYSSLFCQFQIYQHKDYSIEIRVKEYNHNEMSQTALDKIQRKLQMYTYNEVSISIVTVDNINDDRGKIRYIISEVSLEKLHQKKQ